MRGLLLLYIIFRLLLQLLPSLSQVSSTVYSSTTKLVRSRVTQRALAPPPYHAYVCYDGMMVTVLAFILLWRGGLANSVLPSFIDARLDCAATNGATPSARLLVIGMGGCVGGERTRKDGAVRSRNPLTFVWRQRKPSNLPGYHIIIQPFSNYWQQQSDASCKVCGANIAASRKQA